MTDCEECSDATTCTHCDTSATNKNIAIAGAGCVSDTGCGTDNYADTSTANCMSC